MKTKFDNGFWRAVLVDGKPVYYCPDCGKAGQDISLIYLERCHGSYEVLNKILRNLRSFLRLLSNGRYL